MNEAQRFTQAILTMDDPSRKYQPRKKDYSKLNKAQERLRRNRQRVSVFERVVKENFHG